jgi:membrane protein YqaA with SNARE-associated domain
MCPVCVANMTLIAVGATSSGGLTAFIMSKFCRKKKTNQTRGKQNETKRDGTRNGSE